MAAQCRAKTMPQKSKSLAKPWLTHHLPPLLLSIVFLILVTGRIEAAGNDVISVAAANAAETSTLRRPMILRLKREINVMNMDDDDNDNDNDEDDNGGVGVSVGGANDNDNDDEEATLMDTEQQPRSKQTTQKADRDFDFAAYINDFNLQEEASIPEDIFDQHDGDIEDAASVPTADDESDADIILESQRPTSRNFSVYLETAKKYPKNNYKLRNNKEANTKSTTNVSNGQRENEKGNGKAKEQTDANFGRKSFAYKKLKNMHEQKQQQQQLKQKNDENEDDEEDELEKEMEEQEQEQEQEQEEQENEKEIEKQQRRQLFDSIEIFNERKFNKPSVDENHDEIEKEPETEQLHEEDGDILAIGDIEDNFSNSNDEVADNVDNDKLAATSIPTTTTYSPTSTASSTTTTTTRDTMTTTTPSTSVPFIGKKLKRRYYDLGHMQSKPTETSADNENDKMKENQQDLTLGELHYYDATQNLEHKLPNYFGRTLTKKNRTNIERFVDDDYSEQEPPQDMDKPQNVASIADIYYQEDAMTTTTAAVPTFAATTTTTPPPPPYSSYPYMYTQTSSYSTPSPSAFERFKALRRSNHRNGHKSHKKRYKDYLRHHSAANEMVSKHMQKLRKEQQQQQQQQQDAPHAAPIFALGIRPQRPTIVTPKPFYEGQVNYYDQAQDNDSNEDLEHHTEMQRLIAHDNGNWYRRISPVLRNGIKSSANNGPEQLSPSANSLSLRHHVKQLEPPHHHPYHHQAHQHHHHQHHSHHQHGHNHHQHHHKPQRLPNPYQRKLSPPPPSAHPSQSPSLASSITPPPAPLPPPKQQLGHQITELEQLERYYAKWPHLARVQFQIYDEHYRESHPDLYPDYEEDYETAAEMEEAQQEHGDEANLPPYIKKYNRRNKQLLNLLEGTLPPPSPPPLSISAKETRAGVGGGEIAPRLVWSKSVLQPGPHQSAPVATQPLGIHLDDDYLKQKRRRYHQQHREENLFAQQQQQQPRSSTTTMASPTIASVTSTGLPNQLPEEDLEQGASPFDYWNSRAGIAAVGEAVRDGDGASTSTAKPALYKLPSYPAITSSFLGTPRSRSRSAQFVANVSGRGQSSWRQTDAIQSTMENNATIRPPPPPAAAPPSSPLNSFVYHRVNDAGPDSPSLPSSAGFASSSSSASSSPSSSLSSSLLSSRKQRLPFVAITDRRLESLGSKKLLAERHKDFEQNHFPLP
ncbi:LIM domain-containing protein A [Drosophila willistoni]|uniref:LIM domain-containing protein A n=1 Tax=Drosophila willistoni TaxID=7260 RepID=UPI00017D71C5|nr:LIM domain-containing protein A [Drosophila willistoni]